MLMSKGIGQLQVNGAAKDTSVNCLKVKTSSTGA